MVGALAGKYLHRPYALSIGRCQFGTSADPHSLEVAGTTNAPQSYHAWLFRRHPADRIELVDASWCYFPKAAREADFVWSRTLPAYYWGWWDGAMEDTFDVLYRFDRPKYERFMPETHDPQFLQGVGAILTVADRMYERPDLKVIDAAAVMRG